MPYLSLRLFYYTSIACMITTIAVCWMPFDTWWHCPWLFVSGLVHCLEITFEWCQSIAFIQLCFKLSHAHSLSQDMKQSTDAQIFAKEERFQRLSHISLIIGLLIANSLFFIYIAFVFSTDNTDDIGKNQFVQIEVACQIVGTISSAILIVAIFYTVHMLSKLYPGRDFDEKTRIIVIAMIFLLSAISKFVYQWEMYYQHSQKDQKIVRGMLTVQCILMPILWDVIPIYTIYYLHQVNKSNTKDASDQLSPDGSTPGNKIKYRSGKVSSSCSDYIDDADLMDSEMDTEDQ